MAELNLENSRALQVSPRDITDVVVFLASDSARWMTGEKITVSGDLH